MDSFKEILARPPIVEFETVNICNAKCNFCLYKDKVPKKAIMDESLFKRVAAEVADAGTGQLRLVPMLGDPLLDDGLVAHVLHLRELGNLDCIRLVTNGLAFDHFCDDELIQVFSVLDILEISLGPNRDVYHQMFGVDRFEHLVRQLERVANLMDVVTRRPTTIRLCGRACGQEFSVDGRLAALASRLCGNKKIDWTREYMDWGGAIGELPLGTPILRTNIRGKAVVPCYYSMTPHIYQDGRVGLCACAGADDSLLIGDLRQQSWKDILASDDRLDFILSFLDGTMPDYCARCSFYRPSTGIDWAAVGNRSKTGVSNQDALVEAAADNSQQKDALLTQAMGSARGVLHLGAHLGQEAAKYAKYKKAVVWVEALPNIFKTLVQNLRTYPDQKALCALLGDRNGVQQTFHVSNNMEGVSSSMFAFGAFGAGDRSLWPELELSMIDSLTLPVLRLDALLEANGVDADAHDFWVVDLQGAELIALRGAGAQLKKCRAMYIEVSTVEVYKGGVQWPELKAFLQKNGMVPLWEPDRAHDDVLFVRETDLDSAKAKFQSAHYLRHNQRRLEHLASLGLDLAGKTVLEIGAGIGDHSHFYLDRGCSMVVTEGRANNFAELQRRYERDSRVKVQYLDLDIPFGLGRTFPVIHCFGLLYHLQNPEQAIRWMADHCEGIMIIETCVSYGNESALNPVEESEQDVTQALHGLGCRPTRTWVWDRLRKYMPYVYATATQPAHEEFPLNWEGAVNGNGASLLARAVFVASRHEIVNNTQLLAHLPQNQRTN